MSTWEVIGGIVIGLLVAAIGFVLGKISSHGDRITRLETRMNGEFEHLSAGMADIKFVMSKMADQIAKLNETIARNNL